MEKSKINFKPLHEGVGFHPFSDGLPYAPESKSKTNLKSGTGATLAGQPRIAPAIQSVSRPDARQLPQVRTARQLEAERLRARDAQPFRPEPTKLAQIQNQAAPVTPLVQPSATADLLRARAFAYLLDCLVHAAFWMATNLAALFFFKFQIDAEILREHFFQFISFFLISQWIFVALQEVLFETSIGKIFFNLEFRRDHGSLFLRSFVFAMGLMTLGIGFFARPQDRLGELQFRNSI